LSHSGKYPYRHQANQNHKQLLSRIAQGVMLVQGLEPEFSAEVHAQLDHIKEAARESGPDMRDLRDLPWCSIDNDDSRDLDQLTVMLNSDPDGYCLLVAIADVDALVKKDTPIDEHACINTRSVYTSARIFPMLPLNLSTNLTSLNPGEDRLAMICEMHFSLAGHLKSSSIYRAMVRNQVQLAYDATSDWLEGHGALPDAARKVNVIGPQLKSQDALAQKLRVLRHENGSLEFDVFQPRASFIGNEISGITQQPHNRARQLIEEFMIATNGCTSRFLSDAGIYSLRRVVRSPERWLRIVKVALENGYKLPPEPDAQALEAFLATKHKEDPVRFPDLSLLIVKLMGSGEYVVEKPSDHPIGHFGLAVSDYMHSTAPNRRYPDLITMRLIKSILAHEPPPYSVSELHDLALHCTLQEDAAKKVERQLRKSEAALLLRPRIGQSFDGIISGVNEKGTWVRIFNPPVEGRLMEDIQGYTVGQLVRVKLVSTHVERGFIDFAADA
jgi:exoribonuclease-2